MSTKTTFKRIALVTVAALGFGVLTSVVPAQAAASTALNAVVGPNGATSLTVVAGSDTPGALVRLDVTNDETSTFGRGLEAGESITATVVGVPTSVTAKTLAANGGSLIDTSTLSGVNGRSDFVMLETAGQESGTAGATAATSLSRNTDWSLLASATTASATRLDTATAAASLGGARSADGQLGSLNTHFLNKDTWHQSAHAIYTKSYYVTIVPRVGATVIDQGAYTIQFQMTNAAGVVISTKTVKIDFVSSAARSDATLTATPVGNFLRNGTLSTFDTGTSSAGYVSLTLRNRDGGLVRNGDGTAPNPSARIQWISAAGGSYSDTATLTVSDTGTYGIDFGTNSATSPGNGTLQSFDGIYGVVGTLPATASAISPATVPVYRWWFGYGNAALLTPALTVFPASGAGTAEADNTDVLVTAAGMSAANQLKISNDADAAYTWTLPTTTKTATLKFWVQTSADTATPAAAITVTPTWSGPHGSTVVTPATSTTGTVYTTDAEGNFSVTVTNDAPVTGASVSLVLSGAAAFGTGTYTATLTWATAVVSTITVVDPVSGVSVLAGSANTTTVLVRDQFGNPMSGQTVTVSATPTPAIVSTTPAAVIAPLTTGVNGTATYSYTPPAATTTSALLSFNTVPAVTAATHTYTYVATLPVIGTMAAYHGLQWGAAATLTPATGIYNGSTMLVLDNARNISMPITVDGVDTNDEISLRFTGLTAAGVSATGAAVTVTAGPGGWILDALNLPVKSRVFPILSTGTTAVINVLATGTGAITFTATSGTVTATASMWVAGALDAAGRFVTIEAAKTGSANGSGVPVTVKVTDRYGNPVSGTDINVVASGVGSFMGGNITQSFRTDASGTYTFLANTTLSDGGVAKFTATTGSASVGFSSLLGFHGATEVDATLAAGNSSASTEITFAAGASATDVAQAATDAAAEATDAANAATDAANAAAEAADAATAAAQDAADAVAALSTQVTELVSALRKQITSLTNLVIKIQRKVRA
jgi:trimeric autotransporter adhesin